MSKQKKKQLDLSEVGEPIENSLQNSEINDLELTNIINDNMATIKKDLDNMNIELQQNSSSDEKNQSDNEYDYEDTEYDSYVSEHSSQKSEPQNDINLEILHAQQLVTKRDLVYKIQQLQQRLYDVELTPKTFTTADSLNELQAEYDRLYKIKQHKNTRDWYRKILFGVTKGLEWANHKWDPVGLKLDGWSTEVASNADEFDEIFDELSEKYGGSINEKIAPELRLIMLIVYSGVSYSISQSLTQDHSNRPEFTEIINKDPVLRERFMQAATDIQMEKAQPQVSQLFSSVKEFFNDDKPTQSSNLRNFMTKLDNSELNVNELGL